MKPIVLLDCDGPMCDFVGAALDFVEKRTGYRPSRDAIETWHIWDHIGDEAIKKAFNESAGMPGFCASLVPMPGALEGVAELHEIAEVHIVTSPWDSPTWMSERTAWLAQHFSIPASHVHHEPIKYLTRGDFFIDDHPKHVRDWALHRRDHFWGMRCSGIRRIIVRPMTYGGCGHGKS